MGLQRTRMQHAVKVLETNNMETWVRRAKQHVQAGGLRAAVACLES